MNKNQKGIAPLIVILIVVGVLVLGGGGYYIVKKGSLTVPQSSNTEAETPSPSDNSQVSSSPKNFAECVVANNGSYIKTLPAQCEFQGQLFVDESNNAQTQNSSLPSTCVDAQEGTPVITSVSKYFGPVGTQLEIKGCNFSGFEGDKNAWIKNAQGVVGILYGGGGSTGKLLKVTLKSPLCQKDTSYSGLPCDAWLTLTPGKYKIYTYPWGKKSNEVNFTITPTPVMPESILEAQLPQLANSTILINRYRVERSATTYTIWLYAENAPTHEQIENFVGILAHKLEGQFPDYFLNFDIFPQYSTKVPGDTKTNDAYISVAWRNGKVIFPVN